MLCKISCSFGEIVDKVTILKIKKGKAKDKNILRNIVKELVVITKENPSVSQNDKLFQELSEINKQLWTLEDNIREKGEKEFDQDYIKYAELIHKTNDKRYLLKKQINEKYNSYLREEKIYDHISNNKIQSVILNDVKKSKIGKNLGRRKI